MSGSLNVVEEIKHGLLVTGGQKVQVINHEQGRLLVAVDAFHCGLEVGGKRLVIGVPTRQHTSGVHEGIDLCPSNG